MLFIRYTLVNRWYCQYFLHSNKIASVLQETCSSRAELVCRNRSSRPEVFLRKGILKICSKFTGERPCRSVILIKLLCNFIEITLQHGCSPANLLYIFRNPFLKNTSGWLLLYVAFATFKQKTELVTSLQKQPPEVFCKKRCS